MIQMGTVIRIIDNSGARFLRCIKILNVNDRSIGFAGDLIVGSVISVKSKRKVSKGSLQRAVLVGTKKGLLRKTGVKVEFAYNCAVLVDKKGSPLSTRVLGPILEEVRKGGYSKVISLSLKTI